MALNGMCQLFKINFFSVSQCNSYFFSKCLCLFMLSFHFSYCSLKRMLPHTHSLFQPNITLSAHFDLSMGTLFYQQISKNCHSGFLCAGVLIKLWNAAFQIIHFCFWETLLRKYIFSVC